MYLINFFNKLKKNNIPIYDFVSGGAGELTKPDGSKLVAIRILVTRPTDRAAFNVR